jgi:plasmid stabilization system protein ParE
MTRQLIVAPEAEAQIETIDMWWRANRPASPELFEQELSQAFSTIEAAPEAGLRYQHPVVKGIRRVLLRATRNHVYYLDTGDIVVIVAVWGALKKCGPDLSSVGR